MISLKNRNVFLTGATGGIGSEILKELTAEGCNIFPTSSFLYDLRKLDEIYKAAIDAKKELGYIDILINCAGVFEGDFSDIFSVNVKAPYVFIRQFEDEMKKRKWGRIVNIGSTSAHMGVAGSALYCASKHALLGLSRSFYKELNPYNIRVFCISPGTVKTKMGKMIKGDWNTFIDPKELAQYIVYILKFDSELITEEVTINRFRK